MSRVHCLRFDALEARELLSTAHHAAAHAAKAHARPAAVAGPLALDGTLTVNNRATVENMDAEDDTITTVPVSGQLGAMGQVSGLWYESVDAYGDYLGPDTITLHGAQGSVTVAFNNGSPGPAHRTGPHAVYYQHPLQIEGGTGAYAGETGRGTIDLNMNAAHTAVQSITLNAQSK
jgi:hypothetical protein